MAMVLRAAAKHSLHIQGRIRQERFALDADEGHVYCDAYSSRAHSSCALQPPAPQPPQASDVVTWCYDRLGQKAGNGRCADLANQASWLPPVTRPSTKLVVQLARIATMSGVGWSRRLPRQTARITGWIRSNPVIFSSIATLRRCITTTNPNGTWSSVTMTATHHTAVATATESYSWVNGQSIGTIVDTLEQNDNGVQLVVESQLYLADLTGGTIWVYRPIKA